MPPPARPGTVDLARAIHRRLLEDPRGGWPLEPQYGAPLPGSPYLDRMPSDMLDQVAQNLFGLRRHSGETDEAFRARITQIVSGPDRAPEMTLTEMKKKALPLRPTAWQRVLEDDDE